MYRSLRLLLYCIQLFRRTKVAMPKTTRHSCLAYISRTGFTFHIYLVLIVRKMKTNATSFGSCSRIFFANKEKFGDVRMMFWTICFQVSVLLIEKQWLVHWFPNNTCLLQKNATRVHNNENSNKDNWHFSLL